MIFSYIYPPYDCKDWGENENPDIPLIIDDNDYNDMIRGWFGFGEFDVSPKHIILDKDFKYVNMVTTEGEAEIIIDNLLD